jgi:superfamily II DNA/RNA helicase
MILDKGKSGNFTNVVVQSKNGSGKTGAFTVAAALRVDRKNPKIQIIVIGHTRELVN